MGPGLQAKLAVSQPDDIYEQEAVRVADEVMRMPGPLLSRQPAALGIQRKCSACEDEQGLQRKSMSDEDTTMDTSAAVRVTQQRGSALPEAVRSYFEPRFGYDFSGVSVHTDNAAAIAARSLNARAYTLGSNVVFGAGEYAPGTPAGRQLLAHELTHVLQQTSAPDRIQRAPSELEFEVDEFDAQTIRSYLQKIGRGEIEDDSDSDDKARFVVRQWRSGQGPSIGASALSAATKTVLIREMQSGSTGDDDEAAILVLLQNSSEDELKIIFAPGTGIGLGDLESDFDGAAEEEALTRVTWPVAVANVERDIIAAQKSGATARAYLTAFEELSLEDQELRINLLPSAFDARATLGALFAVLPATELDGAFRDVIRRISDLVERRVTRESTGQTDAQMARTQASFMDYKAIADAAAASGGAPENAAETQKAHQRSVNAARIGKRTENRWAALSTRAAQAAFRDRAAAAIANIVARAKVRAPELKLEAEQIQFRPESIDGAEDTRYAEVGDGGGLNVGMDFIDAAVANPDYVLGVVIHEIYGHPAFGEMEESYMFQIFDRARPLTTRALSPEARTESASKAEVEAYGYHGTEIYAELREFRYTAEAPTGSGVKQGDHPKEDVRKHVEIIRRQFAPSLAQGFLRGLYARFRIDPRISPAALALFVAAVEGAFPGQYPLDRNYERAKATAQAAGRAAAESSAAVEAREHERAKATAQAAGRAAAESAAAVEARAHEAGFESLLLEVEAILQKQDKLPYMWIPRDLEGDEFAYLFEDLQVRKLHRQMMQRWFGAAEEVKFGNREMKPKWIGEFRAQALNVRREAPQLEHRLAAVAIRMADSVDRETPAQQIRRGIVEESDRRIGTTVMSKTAIAEERKKAASDGYTPQNFTTCIAFLMQVSGAVTKKFGLHDQLLKGPNAYQQIDPNASEQLPAGVWQPCGGARRPRPGDLLVFRFSKDEKNAAGKVQYSKGMFSHVAILRAVEQMPGSSQLDAAQPREKWFSIDGGDSTAAETVRYFYPETCLIQGPGTLERTLHGWIDIEKLAEHKLAGPLGI